MRRFEKLTNSVAAVSLLLSSCMASGGQTTSVGPQLSSTQSQLSSNQDQLSSFSDHPRIDIVIPVFDPGFKPEDEEIYRRIKDNKWTDGDDRPLTADDYVWPELRRVEAIRFAWKLKAALEATKRFGAVRVTPDASATGDLYLLGRIEESNGKEVEVKIKGVDISGEHWFSEDFDREVGDRFYKGSRNQDQVRDAYDPLFAVIARYVVEQLKNRETAELETLHKIAELRFASQFTEEAFNDYLVEKNGLHTLTSFPAPDDPMLKRTRATRVRDQLFVDGVQTTYRNFSDQIEDSYLVWQKQSAIEVQAKREVEEKATGQAILGVLSLIVAGAAIAAGSDAGVATATVAGIAGATLIGESFQTSQEAEVHRDALRELGDSIDLEFAPQVVKFEEETVELKGTLSEQFTQWRAFLQKIYALESVPDVKL